MNHTVLDSVALGYQPVWGRARQLAAVRLTVQVLHAESVDAEHLWRALGNDWPVAAPMLISAPEHTRAAATRHCKARRCATAGWRCRPRLVRSTRHPGPAGGGRAPGPPAAARRRSGRGARRGHLAAGRAQPAATQRRRRAAGAAPAQFGRAHALARPAAGPDLRRRGRPPARRTSASTRPAPGACSAGQTKTCLHAHRDRPPQCSTGVIEQILAGMEDECSLEQLERWCGKTRCWSTACSRW